MVGNVSQFALQPMANTNHKFPVMGGPRVFHVKCTCSIQLRVLCLLLMSTENDYRCRAQAMCTIQMQGDTRRIDLVLLAY